MDGINSLIPGAVLTTAVLFVKAITDLVKATGYVTGPAVLAVAFMLGQLLVIVGLVAMGVPLTAQALAQGCIAGVGVTLAAVGVTELARYADVAAGKK